MHATEDGRGTSGRDGRPWRPEMGRGCAGMRVLEVRRATGGTAPRGCGSGGWAQRRQQGAATGVGGERADGVGTRSPAMDWRAEEGVQALALVRIQQGKR